VALDSSGNLYVSGYLSSDFDRAILSHAPAPAPAGFQNLPTPCLPNNFAGFDSATATMVDASDGSVRSVQWIDGSSVSVSALAFVNGKVWIAGNTAAFDLPAPGCSRENATLLVELYGEDAVNPAL